MAKGSRAIMRKSAGVEGCERVMFYLPCLSRRLICLSALLYLTEGAVRRIRVAVPAFYLEVVALVDRESSTSGSGLQTTRLSEIIIVCKVPPYYSPIAHLLGAHFCTGFVHVEIAGEDCHIVVMELAAAARYRVFEGDLRVPRRNLGRTIACLNVGIADLKDGRIVLSQLRRMVNAET